MKNKIKSRLPCGKCKHYNDLCSCSIGCDCFSAQMRWIEQSLPLKGFPDPYIYNACHSFVLRRDKTISLTSFLSILSTQNTRQLPLGFSTVSTGGKNPYKVFSTSGNGGKAVRIVCACASRARA